MIFFCFGAVACKDIGREAAVGDDTADGCHAVEVPFAGILTVHEFENAVGTALYGQVDVSAYVGLFCDDVERLVAHVFGVACREADAHAGYGACYGAQEFGEANFRSVGFFPAIRVDVLSE